MKKNIIIIVLAVMCVTFGFLAFNKEKVEDGFNDLSQIKHKTMLSMMLEQNAGEGDYELETRSSWPTEEDGYVFNLTLSKCENGSQLRWDGENNMVVMVGTTSDNCYVYFDVYNPPSLVADVCSNGNNLAGCVKTLYQESDSDITSIYYHNSSLANGAGDNSYRYAGASDDVKNYVCFGSDASTCPEDNLYRIIGVFGDQVKLIKWDYATSTLLGTDGDYSTSCESDTSCNAGFTQNTYKGSNTVANIEAYWWNNDGTFWGSGIWSTSELNTVNLNSNFLTNIGESWASKIATTTWKVGGNTYDNIRNTTAANAYTNEYVNPAETTTETKKIGLMYVSDYGFAAAPSAWTKQLDYNDGDGYSNSSITSVNWMYMGLYEWTVVRDSSSNFVFYVHNDGRVSSNPPGNSSVAMAARPVFYLNNNVTYASGTGTKEDSIRIN